MTISQVGRFSGVRYSHPGAEHGCRAGGAIHEDTLVALA